MSICDATRTCSKRYSLVAVILITTRKSKLPQATFPLPAFLTIPPILYMTISATQDFSLSNLSLNSHSSTEDDWDRSESDIRVGCDPTAQTPRNSVLFPGRGDGQQTPSGIGVQAGKRTLSELLKVYAGKETDAQFSQEEASRVAEVLGQWVSVLKQSFPLPSKLLHTHRSTLLHHPTRLKTTSSGHVMTRQYLLKDPKLPIRLPEMRTSPVAREVQARACCLRDLCLTLLLPKNRDICIFCNDIRFVCRRLSSVCCGILHRTFL
jgi:hypothetical protein